jgi:hypothetical protein
MSLKEHGLPSTTMSHWHTSSELRLTAAEATVAKMLQALEASELGRGWDTSG